jgi:DNA topoisomerase-1
MISKATKSSRPAPALPLLLSLLVLLMNPALLLTRAFSQLKVRRVSFIPTISLPVTHQGSRSQADRILDTRIWKSSRSRSALAVARIDIAAVKPATRPYRLVIVESPSKCNTISNILNQYVKDNGLEYDFVVTASFGHVRNLPKSGGKNETVVGVDVHNRYQPKYEILPGKEGLVRDLQSLATDAQQVILAMDEDREGEAIAWHTAELLTKDTPQVRVTFTEITPKAILAAIEQPRGLDMNLVEAQETRRVLDRLAGYTLSPLLWKKIAPGLSAGRVQSVGMALVVQRERERLVFVSANYWDLAATFDGNVTATLVQVNGQTIACGADFNDAGELTSPSKVHVDQQHAEAILAAMANGELNVWLQNPNESKWSVSSIKSRERSQNSPMPFITSTLQQESVRKVGLSVSQTMSCAQKLYEAGYISYMRTDSTHLSEDAHTAVAGMIASSYGEELIAPQRKSKKSKNAQESHEAIRPAIQPNGGFLAPSELGDLNGAEKDLYELIYQRTIASRMTPQRLNSTSMEIEGASPDGKTKLLFRVTGSVVIDPGYTLAYGRSNDGDQLLPSWLEGESVMCQDLSSVSHETKPPPRYTEASFVKELESLGVGRPSTYAGTVQILRDRAYVGTPVKADGSGSSKQKKSRTGSSISAQRAAGGEDFTGGGRGPLVPSLSAFVVTSLMENHLTTYVDPSFTAGLEDKLDMIARGEEGANRVSYLDEFYAGDEGLAAKVQRIDESVDSDNARRANLPGLFTNEEGDAKGDIALMIGPWGPYIQRMNSNTTAKPVTAQLPAGMASDLTTITRQSLATLLESREKDGVLLGHHPEDEREIRLKVGRYGAYLQWGKQGDEDTTNHSLPRHIGSMRNLDFSAMNDPEEGATSLSAMIGLSFEEAVLYVGLPRTICTLNELPIIAAIGPYGPYLKYNETFMSLNKGDGEVLDIDAIEAEKLVIERIIEKKSGTYSMYSWPMLVELY